MWSLLSQMEIHFHMIRRTPALTEARRLRDNGVEILAVGIMGMYRSLDEDFLRGISSGNNYFTVASFDQLETVREPLLGLACSNKWVEPYSLHFQIFVNGESAGECVSLAPFPSVHSFFLQFHARFQEKITKIIGCHTSAFGIGAPSPPSGKSWIR